MSERVSPPKLRLSARTRPLPRQIRLGQMPRLYTPREASVVLRTTVRSIKQLLRNGCLGGFRAHTTGSPWWTTDIDILAYMGWVVGGGNGAGAKAHAATKHGHEAKLTGHRPSREALQATWKAIHARPRPLDQPRTVRLGPDEG